MSVSRRSFLRTGLTTGAALGLAPGIGGLAFAQDEPASPLLVIVHLRGGCDGLNLVSPASDPDFIAARPSELRVLTEGADAGHVLANGPDATTEFRLHTAASALAELYRDGHLAFIHAAGLPDQTRSHFVATDMIEHGVSGAASLARMNSGWIARYAVLAGMAGPGAAIAASSGLGGDLLGAESALAVPDLGGGFGVPGGPPVEQLLHRFYTTAPGAVGVAGRRSLAAMRLLDSRLPRDAQNKPLPYAPEHDAAYDPGGDLGRALKTVAQIAKLEIGLRIATVDVGGWDTHEAQAGRFRNCVQRLSNGIGAFYADMARHHDRLTLVTVTEFGRRLRSNRSGGTDHGRASVMAVLGGRIAGGKIYGAWPGLRSERLDEGVDLAVSTDYRQILSELLVAHSGRAALSGVFPGFCPVGPLGLVAGDAPGAPGRSLGKAPPRRCA